MPVGKPAPPRPRRPESLTSCDERVGVHARARCAAPCSRRCARTWRSVQRLARLVSVPALGQHRGQPAAIRRPSLAWFGGSVALSADVPAMLSGRPTRRRSSLARSARAHGERRGLGDVARSPHRSRRRPRGRRGGLAERVRSVTPPATPYSPAPADGPVSVPASSVPRDRPAAARRGGRHRSDRARPRVGEAGELPLISLNVHSGAPRVGQRRLARPQRRRPARRADSGVALS